MANQLLKIGAVAPDFGFGTEGIFIKLSELRDRYRVLLAVYPDGLEADYRNWIRAVADDWHGFEKRDMVAIMLSPCSEDDLIRLASTEPMPVILISDEGRETMGSYIGKAMKDQAVYLIGKDGTVKAGWDHRPSNREVFELVDFILTWQQEIEKRHEAA